MIPERYRKIPYVEGGRDFSGADCWGWPRLLLIHEAGVPCLPKWGRVTRAAQTIMDAAHNDTAGDFQQVGNPQQWDIVCCYDQSGHLTHIGLIMQTPRGLSVAHTTAKHGPSSVSLSRFRRAFYQLKFWRYHG